MTPKRKYYLVIRVGKNSFTPVDWSETSFYEGEDLYSLPGIDKFTSKTFSLDLIKECLKLGILDENDLFSSLEILYIENDKNYTIKEGPIFLEDNYIMGEDFLINYIINNKNNKELINNILMQCNIKETSEELEEFKLILKNIKNIEEPDEILKEYLSIFKNLSYEQKRAICYRLSNSIYNQKQKEYATKKSLKNERKVA